MNHWQNIEYLKNGNAVQRHSFRVLNETGILSILKDFEPIVVGTIPINIDIEGSDLDIVCNASDPERFRQLIKKEFGSFDRFRDDINQSRYVAGFFYSGLEIEIFSPSVPSVMQNGYRHMVIEDRILKLGGEKLRQEIVKLKKEGYKTEPAFGKLLNLVNPYQDLLGLMDMTDSQLMDIIKKHL
ncbi:DUF4269 domain-containing protein [Dysgonomonas sp. 520]|uniref:DUF4269 domain-containing protein n=1 Tax=Dysgonomonas sp. 520 TaxID=2302931 RepID=UPI0013D0318D|nr:DUF4269 domain-containing protein [Dysgonomonas sp. 520]NDW08202.1 DUF4269 domain-containing protein [Dysgonomonas sp. 520]